MPTVILSSHKLVYTTSKLRLLFIFSNYLYALIKYTLNSIFSQGSVTSELEKGNYITIDGIFVFFAGVGEGACKGGGIERKKCYNE